MKEECANKLKELTGKKNIYFTRSGNKAIKTLFKYLKNKNYKKIFIPDQGGWITYWQFSNEMKLELDYFDTNYGIIKKANFEKLINDIKEKTIIIVNSMPAYAYFEDMKEINNIINKNDNIMLINDAAGSIGTPQSFFGHFLVGSFNKWKPLEIGKGGFIATDEVIDAEEEDINFKELLNALNNLDNRINFWENKSNNLKKDLEKLNFKIIHKEKDGYNVIVHFDNDLEKERIINYCDKKELPHAICPRYIRVNDTAVSIEIKRLKGD